MKRSMKYLAMLLTAGLFMTGCSNEEESEAPAGKGKPVKFEMGMASTRTSTGTDYVTTFVEGDAVGIFAYERQGDGSDGAAAVVTNAKYVLGTDNIWAATGEGIYSEAGKSFNYYAYYPYQEGNFDPASIQTTVKLDQSTAAAADYNISDALTANNKTAGVGETNVTLSFIHAFALVQVNLGGDLATKEAVITMQNVFPTAALNAKMGTAGAASGVAGTIKMYGVPAINDVADAKKFAFRAIVPAQAVAANESLLEIATSGKTYRFTYSAEVTYEASKLRVMNVAVGASSQNTITIPAASVTIDKWGTSDEIPGTGGTEEVIIPLIEKPGATLTEVVDNPSALTANTWFALKKKDLVNPAIFSIEADENTTWKKVLKLEFTGSLTQGASWFVAALGYYRTTPMDVSTTTKYKVTAKIKAGAAATKMVFTCRNTDNSASFKVNALPALAAEVTTVSATPGTDWTPYTFYIDFSKKSASVGTVPSSGVCDDATADDYKTFELRIYPGTGKTVTTETIYVSDVTLEPYNP